MKKITIGDIDKLEFLDEDNEFITVSSKDYEIKVTREELMIVLKYLTKGDYNE